MPPEQHPVRTDVLDDERSVSESGPQRASGFQRRDPTSIAAAPRIWNRRMSGSSRVRPNNGSPRRLGREPSRSFFPRRVAATVRRLSPPRALARSPRHRSTRPGAGGKPFLSGDSHPTRRLMRRDPADRRSGNPMIMTARSAGAVGPLTGGYGDRTAMFRDFGRRQVKYS